MERDYSYPINVLITFSISITTTKLWESNYTEYQQYLFNRICEYKEKFSYPYWVQKDISNLQ